MAVCYWGSSQSQTTTQLAGIWAPLHWDQQHTGTLVSEFALRRRVGEMTYAPTARAILQRGLRGAS